MDKVVKLAERDDRASTWAVGDMLESAKKIIEDEPGYAKKAVLILLDDEGRQYVTRTLIAGIGKTTETLALLEIEKLKQMRDMGYLE